MVAHIDRMVPLLRQQGVQVPDTIPASRWIDNLSLTGTTSKSYTIPTDAAGNKAQVLRICTTHATAMVFYNPYAAAVVPVGDVTTGAASAGIPLQRPFLLVVPPGCTAIRFIAATSQVISIEAWA